jgi:hypothetical protein
VRSSGTVKDLLTERATTAGSRPPSMAGDGMAQRVA